MAVIETPQPSGRRLSYVQPRIGQNQFGNDCATYMGIDQQHWERIESYGPKFVENIVQGVARDILCYAMKKLRDRFIVGHVHDELIIEVPMDASMQEICDIMGQTPIVSRFFRKFNFNHRILGS